MSDSVSIAIHVVCIILNCILSYTHAKRGNIGWSIFSVFLISVSIGSIIGIYLKNN